MNLKAEMGDASTLQRSPAILQKLEERHGITSFLGLQNELNLFVTESKHILLTTPQASKLRHE